MKIAILTYPFNANYGGILQNYALQTVLKDRGHQVVTLCNKKVVPTKWYILLLKIPYRIFQKFILGRKDTIVFQESRINKEIPVISQNMTSFVDNNIQTRKIGNIYNEITSDDFDAFIVGSDQVWSPTLSNLYNYYLDFTKGWNVRRIAYAPSYGYNTWKYNRIQTKKCQRLLKTFDKVSVREASGAELCSKYLGIKPRWVLDPTLLLDSNRYRKLFNNKNTNNCLFVFTLDSNSDKSETVKIITQRKQLNPISISAEKANSLKPLQERIQPSVESWLSSIANADFVFTDSYHGMVFSIIFHKQFIAYSNRGAARFESLLDALGIKNRLIRCSSDLNDSVFSAIDYVKVDSLLEKYRRDSINFLESALYAN